MILRLPLVEALLYNIILAQGPYKVVKVIS